ncbi:MAG: response regulator transcription factor [Saprospiraceae bacterium]|nr:response regulator transcription factor [Saprospiraceae bacterium]
MNQELKILIVDDEPDILEFLQYNLTKEGYKVFTSENGKNALELIKVENPHLILLDIMMPEIDGIDLCKMIRKLPNGDSFIIAFLTALDEEHTEINALEIGGDDFINKPIKPNVLSSRIKALLRRIDFKESKNQVKVFGDLMINTEKMLTYFKNEPIQLAKKEFEILQLLSSKPGKVFVRNEIFTKIWGSSVIVGDRTIDVHIRKLREKIGEQYITTVKGIGYKFVF